MYSDKVSSKSTKHSYKGSSKKSFNEQEDGSVVIGSGDMDYESTSQPLTARDEKTRNINQDNITRLRFKAGKLIFVV